jgi:hypothetical protein
MPIERIKVGRKYTERTYIRQVGEPTEEDRQEAERVWNALQEAASLKGKIGKIAEAAIWQLDQSGLPHDPRNPIYSDDWVRQHRYRSLDWYAHHLLLSIMHWRDRMKRDDIEGAMAECISLGGMFHEFCRVGDTIERQSEAGSLPKQLSERRQEERDQRARWREAALGWWDKHSGWSTRAVAKRIAPRHEEACRKAIADLNPNRRMAEQNIVGMGSKIRTQGM